MQHIIDQIKAIGLFYDNRGNFYGDKYIDCITTVGGLWQKPEELASLLFLLKDKNIKTFLNIGTFNGNTFNFIANYLNGITDTICITVDPFEHPEVKKQSPYIYITGTSHSIKGQSFDFVFIDGDHSYNSVKADWDNVGQFAKIIAFHDINADDCPESVQFWQDIKKTVKDDFDIFEFIEPTEGRNLMGIGVLVRR